MGHPGDLWTALMASSALPAGLAGTRPIADYNSDGVVNSSDWTAWQANFGQAGVNYADGNRNGIVDAADYVLWRKILSAVGGGANVVETPETGTETLWLAALAVALCNRARRSPIEPAAGASPGFEAGSSVSCRGRLH